VENLDPKAHALVLKGPLDELDHAPAEVAFGGKLVLDGTRKLPEEGPAPPPTRPGPVSHPEVVAQSAWPGVLALTMRKTRPHASRALAEEVLKDPAAAGTRLLLITDDLVDPRDEEMLMWLLLANLDPARDAWFLGDTLVLDGTRKFPEEGHPRPWPEVARLPEEVVQRLTPLMKRLGLA